MSKAESRKRSPINKKRARRNGYSLQTLMGIPYKVELMPLSSQDGGGYFASIPLLKGCQSDGRSPDDAIRNLREAQRAWLASALKHGDPIPLPQ